MTRGLRAVRVYLDYPRGGEHFRTASTAPANVIDTVGAGDAFTAAMVCLHLEGRPLRECARFANHYAARVCEHRGGHAADRPRRGRTRRGASIMLMPPDWRPPTLTTPRLVLRPFVEADAATALPARQEPERHAVHALGSPQV